MSDLTWHSQKVSKKDREKLLNQKGAVIWVTGLSGCGKSTLANNAAKILHEKGKLTYVLDGDNVRLGLNKDLKFSDGDRVENIRRVGEVAKLMCDAGIIVFVAFISPFKKQREEMKNDNFIEVYMKCSMEELEKRDPKGLYKKAENGEIQEFTGKSSPYEIPTEPDLTLDTEKNSEKENAQKLIEYLKETGII